MKAEELPPLIIIPSSFTHLRISSTTRLDPHGILFLKPLNETNHSEAGTQPVKKKCILGTSVASHKHHIAGRTSTRSKDQGESTEPVHLHLPTAARASAPQVRASKSTSGALSSPLTTVRPQKSRVEFSCCTVGPLPPTKTPGQNDQTQL